MTADGIQTDTAQQQPQYTGEHTLDYRISREAGYNSQSEE